MATVNRFEDLEVWKLSREIVNEIYDLTHQSSFSRDFSLCNQIRRSAVSILSNISEGFESGSDAQFARYLKIAKGSAGECRAQLYIALDQHYMNQKEFNDITRALIRCSKKLSRLIDYLNGCNQAREFEIVYGESING